MSRALASELARLRGRRAVWWVLIACVATTAVISWGLSVIAIEVQAEAGRVSVEDAAALLVSRGSIAAVVAGVLGAVVVGSEFRHGTLNTTVLMTPRRSTVVVSKLTALAVLSGLLAASCAATGLLVGRAVLRDDVTGGLGATDALALVAAHAVFVSGCSALGACAAFLLQSQVQALAVMIAFPLVVEPSLRGAATVSGSGWLGDAVALLPWAAGSALQERATGATSSLLGQGGPSPLTGSAVFLGVVAAAVWAACALFARRDLPRSP